jgi:hypothetical protein
MAQPIERAFAEQVENFKQQIERGGLPFGELLDAREIDVLLAELGATFRERVYTPEVVVRMFLLQALSEDGSCRNAVSRLIAERVAQRRAPCSPNTGSYCAARGRLPEELLRRLARQIGQRLEREARDAWRWKERVVKIVDGTIVSMPDTPENQAAFPQHPTQKPGLGFPLARLVVVFSLAVGTVIDMTIGSYQGKRSGENTLFRSLWEGALEAGDVLTGDRHYCSYVDIALLAARKVDIVFRKHQLRASDFRRGRRLGKHDHLITWRKPQQRPAWMDADAFARLPGKITLREVRVIVAEKGLRVRQLVIVTTLLSPHEYPREEIAELYRQRWHAELDLRSIKSTMNMDVLRTETPAVILATRMPVVKSEMIRFETNSVCAVPDTKLKSSPNISAVVGANCGWIVTLFDGPRILTGFVTIKEPKFGLILIVPPFTLAANWMVSAAAV